MLKCRSSRNQGKQYYSVMLTMVQAYLKTFLEQKEKKETLKIFENNVLSSTVKSNLKTADFLDINFDLVKEIHQPNKKPNDDNFDINKRLNDPSSILQQLPEAISKIISEISAN